MGSIHILPKIIQNQIAAGEVVERPASIVKELVENSLDAKATDIRIEITAGGIDAIVIVDNGTGMEEEDALLSIKRHATSKIQTTDDLFSIHSYGFRGEALASISAVSHFTLSTKTAQNTHGIELRMIEEEILSSTAKGLPNGTRIAIEQLFFNTPARKKYLKTPQTEYSYILRLTQELALSHPHVSFTLVHNDKVTFAARTGNMDERIREVLGKKFMEESTPLFLDSPSCVIHGRVSKPFAAKSTRREQYILVNGRPIQSDIIAKAASEAFHRILPPGMHPALCIHLTVPAEEVDVNVHPRKKEVKFVTPQRIFSDVKRTISDSIAKHEVAPSIEFTKTANTIQKERNVYNPLSKAVSPYATHFQRESSTSLFSPQTFAAQRSSPVGHFVKEQATVLYKQTSPYRVLGQLHNCYIVAEGTEGCILIDQHAAHERVLFDALCKNRAISDIPTQQLLTAEVLEVTPLEHAKVIEHLDDFFNTGFTIEDIGDGSISLSTIPASLQNDGHDIAGTLRNMLHEFEGLEGECNQSHSLRTFHEKVLAYTACRGAVKFGDALSIEEMQHILEQLAQTERPDTCPHGRTSRVIIGLDALKKLFDR